MESPTLSQPAQTSDLKKKFIYFSRTPTFYLFIADRLSGVIAELKHKQFFIAEETYRYKSGG
jgi:hypothetical protein